jgi:hypothetical protein
VSISAITVLDSSDNPHRKSIDHAQSEVTTDQMIPRSSGTIFDNDVSDKDCSPNEDEELSPSKDNGFATSGQFDERSSNVVPGFPRPEEYEQIKAEPRQATTMFSDKEHSDTVLDAKRKLAMQGDVSLEHDNSTTHRIVDTGHQVDENDDGHEMQRDVQGDFLTDVRSQILVSTSGSHTAPIITIEDDQAMFQAASSTENTRSDWDDTYSNLFDPQSVNTNSDTSDTATNYSVESDPADSGNDYIHAFARQLAVDLEPSPGSSKLSTVPPSYISEALRLFSWKLHEESRNPFQWEISVILHRKRE